MLNSDSFLSKLLLRNGGWLTIPPLAITFGLWSHLPPPYAMEHFWKDIPSWLGLPENIFRIIVFALPTLLYFGRAERGQKLGWFLYFGGLLAYLASYVAQVLFAESTWSLSALGFTAPAWTTTFWFCGIGMVCKNTWLPLPWNRMIYVGCAVLFLIFHVTHTGLIFSRLF